MSLVRSFDGADFLDFGLLGETDVALESTLELEVGIADVSDPPIVILPRLETLVDFLDLIVVLALDFDETLDLSSSLEREEARESTLSSCETLEDVDFSSVSGGLGGAAFGGATFFCGVTGFFKLSVDRVFSAEAARSVGSGV